MKSPPEIDYAESINQNSFSWLPQRFELVQMKSSEIAELKLIQPIHCSNCNRHSYPEERYCTFCNHFKKENKLCLAMSVKEDSFYFYSHFIDKELIHSVGIIDNIFDPKGKYWVVLDLALQSNRELDPLELNLKDRLSLFDLATHAFSTLRNSGIAVQIQLQKTTIGQDHSQPRFLWGTSSFLDQQDIDILRELAEQWFSKEDPWALSSSMRQVISGHQKSSLPVNEESLLPPKWTLHSQTDLGHVRRSQQDALATLQFKTDQVGKQNEKLIFALADGMGGYAGGELAASRAILQSLFITFGCTYDAADKPFEEAEIATYLLNAVRFANDDIRELQYNQPVYADMGTTLIVGYLDQSEGVVYLAHCGDSRAYFIDMASPSIRQITQDQNLAWMREEQGQELHHQECGDALVSSLGQPPEEVLVHQHKVVLDAQTRLLLCSDGLTKHLSDETILGVILTTPSNPVSKLIHAANQAGGSDNISVIYLSPEVSQ